MPKQCFAYELLPRNENYCLFCNAFSDEKQSQHFVPFTLHTSFSNLTRSDIQFSSVGPFFVRFYWSRDQSNGFIESILSSFFLFFLIKSRQYPKHQNLLKATIKREEKESKASSNFSFLLIKWTK